VAHDEALESGAGRRRGLSASSDRVGEIIANSVTHGIGTVLSVTGTIVLVTLASARGSTLHVVSCSVYGATLVLLYMSSTLYHALPGRRVKHVFRIFDHSSIYLLIAGTYTPFTLVSLRGGWGWTLFGTVWCLAVCGVVFKSLWVDLFPIMSAVVYIAMGWLVVFGVKPLLATVSWKGLLWLVAGGLFYTTGVFFFASKKVRYSHAIWHVFVLAGSVCHYCAVLLYVLPR
jgi:hemolysin III